MRSLQFGRQRQVPIFGEPTRKVCVGPRLARSVGRPARRGRILLSIDHPKTSVRFALREATADVHSQLEEVVGRLDAPSAYARYVRGMHAFRTALEPMLPKRSGWRTTLLCEALADDMDDLGLAPASPPRLDASVDADWLLGAHYVLEGSALGARVLVKQVAALGFGEEFGARHLWLQARGVGWGDFVRVLDAQTADVGLAIAGARATFAAAADAMRKARAYG